MSRSKYVSVGGVEWCSAHAGVVDECSDHHGRCDMHDAGEGQAGPCVIHEVFHTSTVLRRVADIDEMLADAS